MAKFWGKAASAPSSGSATIGLVTSWDSEKVGSTITGIAPLGIVFDLCDTTDVTKTSKPFRHLLYYHDFGETTGLTWAVSGRSKDNDYGPIVAHTYETPGTYTYTVTVTDSGGDTTTDELTIVVQDPDVEFSGTSTICYSQSGDFTGAPSGASLVTSSSFADVIAAAVSGTRVLLRRGDTFSSSTTNRIDVQTKFHLGAFGSGARPLVSITGTGNAIDLTGCVDGRIVDLSFVGASPFAMTAIEVRGFNTAADKTQRILFKDIDADNVGTMISVRMWFYPDYSEGLVFDSVIGTNLGPNDRGGMAGNMGF